MGMDFVRVLSYYWKRVWYGRVRAFWGWGESRGCALIAYQNLSMLYITLEFQGMIYLERNDYS